MNKREYVEERVRIAANLMLDRKLTIREIAAKLCCSKSTIHKDLCYRLPKISAFTYESVREILNEHLEERHLLGGMATKYKYAKGGN